MVYNKGGFKHDVVGMFFLVTGCLFYNFSCTLSKKKMFTHGKNMLYY
nr:MAG TPA: hypothetical protein [Caudoviricetes sp.]